MTVRILFMGTPSFAVPSLNALTERPDLCSVEAVITQPDRPAGRGRSLTEPPVKLAAKASNVPVLQPKSLRSEDFYSNIAQFRAELVVVAAYGKILPEKFLNLPQWGCINVHASLLPKHRGASPVAHSIMAGDREAGVCIMQMEKGLDTGPVYEQAAISIEKHHNRGTLTEELSQLGAKLLVETLPTILDRSKKPIRQVDANSTYAPLLKKQDGLLDFTLDANTLALKVRGLSPWPGAFAMLADQRVLISQVTTSSHNGPPGTVIEANSKSLIIACGSGSLVLKEIRPAGKKLMSGGAWVAGRGVEVGDLFNKN